MYTHQPVFQVRPEGAAGDWKLMRTVTASDTAMMTASVFTGDLALRSPFVDLRFFKASGTYGTFVVEMGEVVLSGAANVGCKLRMPFKDCSDSLTISADGIVPGITASGRLTVKITSLTAGMKVLVYGRPS